MAFFQIHIYNSSNIAWIYTKFGTKMRLILLLMCAKLEGNLIVLLRLLFFASVQKDKKEENKENG